MPRHRYIAPAAPWVDKRTNAYKKSVDFILDKEKLKAKLNPVIPKRSEKHRIAMEKQSNRCYWCCKDLTYEKVERDHLIPRCDGGSDDDWNLRAVCWHCNHLRNASLPMDYALYLLGADYHRRYRKNMSKLIVLGRLTTPKPLIP